MIDETNTMDLTGRHPSTVQIARWLVPNPNLPGAGAVIAREIAVFAFAIIHALPDGPELTAGLRKLVEAKDCLVRAALEESGS